MPWEYNQTTGDLKHNGKLIGSGYSGAGKGKNNHSMQGAKNTGPIPTGNYHIGTSYKHATKGPVVMNLDPIQHNALGRTAFRVHGDNVSHTASEGCIILNRTVRETISKSTDRTLHVVSGTRITQAANPHKLNSNHLKTVKK